MTEIQQASIGRVTDKNTHEVYYVVKSDSSETTWYTVRWNNAACEWQCNCPSHKPCKHERAVNEVLKIRRLAVATAMGPGAVKAVKELQAVEDKKFAARERAASQPKGTLNGNQGFSLMR